MYRVIDPPSDISTITTPEATAEGGDANRRVFHHLAAPKVGAYRAILRLFVAAKERFEIALRPSDILARLDAGEQRQTGLEDEDLVTSSLGSLCDWGNLSAARDVVSARTIDEYLRPKLLYQLTQAGDLAERALVEFDKGLARPGELSASALRDIAEALDELQGLMESDELDAGKAVRTLNDLVSRFDRLVARAQMFIGGLQRELDRPEAEESSFLALKEELLGYLDRFVKELVNSTYRVSRSLQKLEGRDIGPALEAAAIAELKDALLPTEAQRSRALQNALRTWRGRWEGLRGWFIGAHDHPAHAESLRARALAAIPALLERVQRMHALRANRADRATDFLTLARWFAEAPEEDDLHRLWRVAFGLHSCRHLRVNVSTLQSWAEIEDRERPSWETCPPYLITITQWERGRSGARGKPPSIIDRSAARAALRAQADAESRVLNEARKAIAKRTPCSLSELEGLDLPGFDVLMDAVGEAYAVIGYGETTGIATTADGGLHVKIELPKRRAAEALLLTPAGILRGPDLLITLKLTDQPFA